MSRTSDWLVWKPRSTGNFTLTLEIPKHRDETLTENNRMTAPISIREEKLRVLVVESYPRWEYRYLRNALSRDPGVERVVPALPPGALQGRAAATRTTSSNSPPGLTSCRVMTSFSWAMWASAMGS